MYSAQDLDANTTRIWLSKYNSHLCTKTEKCERSRHPNEWRLVRFLLPCKVSKVFVSSALKKFISLFLCVFPFCAFSLFVSFPFLCLLPFLCLFPFLCSLRESRRMFYRSHYIEPSRFQPKSLLHVEHWKFNIKSLTLKVKH